MRAVVAAIAIAVVGCTYEEKHPSADGAVPIDAPAPVDAIDAPEGVRIGGRVDGLWTGGTVMLRLRAGDVDVVEGFGVEGDFAFAARLDGGETYQVSVEAHPVAHACTVTAGGGVLEDADVTSVIVTCVGPMVTIGTSEAIGFTPGVRAYAIDTAIVTSTLDVSATAAEGVTIAIDGLPAAGPRRIELPAGPSVHHVDFAAGPVSRRYTIAVDRGGRPLDATYWKAMDAAAGDRFGDEAVAVTADRLAIGAPGRPVTGHGTGAVFVYRRTELGWQPDGVLSAGPGGGAGDEFGCAVAVSIDTIAVAACGEDSSTSGVGAARNELGLDSGAVHVFVRQQTGWVQQAFVKPANTGGGDRFGHALALYGDTLVIGAPNEDGGSAGVDGQPNEDLPNAGAAYVLRRIGSTWAQFAYLKSGQPAAGGRFGQAVAIEGGTIAVGAPGEAGTRGAAYVFAATATSWAAPVQVREPTSPLDARFGYQVALSADRLAVAAPGGSAVVAGGEVLIFQRSGAAWPFVARVTAPSPAAGDELGAGLALVRDVLIVAAFRDASGAATGVAHVFGLSGATWVHRQLLAAPMPGTGDDLGLRGVSIGPGVVVLGAGGEDGSATGSGGDDLAPDSGAVYLFR